MTIIYPNGDSKKAVVVMQDDKMLRVTAQGDSDAMAIRRQGDSWVTESGERVTIQFEWERLQGRPVPAVEDCVCSKKLASSLIASLLNPERDELEEQLLSLSTGVPFCVPVTDHVFVN